MSAATYVQTPEGHRIVPGEKEYIPNNYRDHSNPSTPVTFEGEPLGFTVGDVMPTRRWAINEDGEVMGQYEFEAKYRVWHGFLVAPNNTIVSITAANKYHDLNLDPVPLSREFVSYRRSDGGGDGLVPITVTEAPPAAEPLIGVANAQGEITDEPSEKVPHGYVVKEESPTEKALREEIAALKAKVAADAPPQSAPQFNAYCGYTAKSKAGMAAHSRHCEKCQEENGE